jgi:hypothetical protein
MVSGYPQAFVLLVGASETAGDRAGSPLFHTDAFPFFYKEHHGHAE